MLEIRYSDTRPEAETPAVSNPGAPHPGTTHNTALPAEHRETILEVLAKKDLAAGRAIAISYLHETELISEKLTDALKDNDSILQTLTGSRSFAWIATAEQVDLHELNILLTRINSICGSTLALIPCHTDRTLLVNYAETRAEAVRNNPAWTDNYKKGLWTESGFGLAVIMDSKFQRGWFHGYFNNDSSPDQSTAQLYQPNLLKEIALEGKTCLRDTAVKIESLFVLSGRKSDWLNNCLESYLSSLMQFGHSMPTVYVLHEGDLSNEADKLSVLKELSAKYECKIIFVGQKEKEGLLAELELQLRSENPSAADALRPSFPEKVLGTQRNWAHLLAGGKPYSVVDDDSLAYTLVPADQCSLLSRLPQDSKDFHKLTVVVCCYEAVGSQLTKFEQLPDASEMPFRRTQKEEIDQAADCYHVLASFCEYFRKFSEKDQELIYNGLRERLIEMGENRDSFKSRARDGHISNDFCAPIRQLKLLEKEYQDPENNELLLLAVDVFGFHYNHIGQNVSSLPYLTLEYSIGPNVGTHDLTADLSHLKCRVVDGTYCGKGPGGTFHAWNRLFEDFRKKHFNNSQIEDLAEGEEQEQPEYTASWGGQPVAATDRAAFGTTTMITLDGHGTGLMRPGVLDSNGLNKMVQSHPDEIAPSINCGLHICHEGARRVFGQLDIGVLGKKLWEEALFSAVKDDLRLGREEAVIELASTLINVFEAMLRANDEVAKINRQIKEIKQAEKESKRVMSQLGRLPHNLQRELMSSSRNLSDSIKWAKSVDTVQIFRDLQVMQKVADDLLKTSGLRRFQLLPAEQLEINRILSAKRNNPSGKRDGMTFESSLIDFERRVALRYLHDKNGTLTHKEILERALQGMLDEISAIDRASPLICAAAWNSQEKIAACLNTI